MSNTKCFAIDKIVLLYNVTDRYMQDVLGAIFEQLDQQSLQNAELVSNKWKMAIADGNPSKLWDKFLHEKV